RSLAEKVEAAAADGFVRVVGGGASWGIEQVAGGLLYNEVVEWQIEVERADHVVSIAIRVGDVGGKFIPRRFSVSDEVKPMAAPALAQARACQQPLHEFFVGIGRLVGEKRSDFFGGGG